MPLGHPGGDSAGVSLPIPAVTEPTLGKIPSERRASEAVEDSPSYRQQ